MSYIGRGTDAISNVEKLDNITFNGGTTYALTKSSAAFTPVGANNILISIDGVIQQGNFSVSTTNIVFDWSPTSSNTCNFILHYGTGVLNVPADGSIVAAKMAANSVDSDSYVDLSIDTAHIGATQVTGAKLNTDVISAQTALGATPADTDELLVSDAGVLKRVDYSYLKGITAANFRPNAKPLIINGDMQVAQRSISETGVTGDGYQTIDRMRTTFDGSHRWTLTQEALTADEAFEDGFSKAYKFDCTTADASLGASDKFWFKYSFEGQDVQLFKKGTASAEKTTIAFWVKATKTGTNIVELYDESSTNRHCSVAYTISSSNTWEKKVVVIPADTSGTVVDNTNGQTIDLYFIFASGSNYTDGASLQTTWIDYSSGSTRNKKHYGQVNHADSTSNNVHITGIQVEVGEYTSSTIPPFQHESYGDNLERCSRYFQVMARGLVGRSQTTTQCSVGGTYPYGQMRATPTITLNSAGLASSIQDPGVNAHTISNIELNASNYLGVFVKFLTSASTQVVGNVMVTNGNANPLLLMNAEL